MMDTKTIQKADGNGQKKEIQLNGDGLQLVSFDDLWRFALCVYKSGLACRDDTPETIVIKVQMGYEYGMKPMQAVQNIAVINGRPCLWGDAVPGICRGSGKCEWLKQEELGTPYEDGYGWRVSTKRFGDPLVYESTFTVVDAKKAKLWTKPGPWQDYPKRMLLNRARAYACRDAYPDVMKGIYTREEVMDIHDAEYEVVEDDRTATEKLKEQLAEQAAVIEQEDSQPPQETVSESQEPEPSSRVQKARKGSAKKGDGPELFDEKQEKAPQTH